MRRHIVFFGILLLYGNFLPGYPQVTAASTETSDLLIASGDSLMLFENFSGAQKEFIKALELAESIKDERKALAILNRLGRSAIELNDSTKARRYLRHAKRIAGQYPNAAPERAGTLATWGLYYNQFGPDSLAASYFERSLDILQTCCAEEHGMLGSVCLDYAKFWCRIKYPGAEEMAILSTEYLRQVSGVSRIKLADAYNLCGSMVRERGETELRNHYVNGAAQILSVFPKAPPNLAIQIYANLAAQKVDADQFQDAVIIYRNIKNLIMTSGVHTSDLYIYLAMIGSCEVDLDLSGASESLKSAENLLKSHPDPDQQHLGFIHHRLAKHHRNQEQIDSAVFYFDLALTEYASILDSNFISELFVDFAEMNLELDRPRIALNQVNQALLFAGYQEQEVFQPALLQENNIDRFFNPLELKGRVLYELFNHHREDDYLDKSLEVFAEIEQLAEFTRNGSYTEETKRIVSEHFHRGAEGALKTLCRLNQRTPQPAYVTRAFNFIEHNRYAQLFQDLNRSKAFTSLGLNDDISKKYAWFYAQLERLQNDIVTRGNDSQLQVVLHDSLLEIQNSFQTFKNEVKHGHVGEYTLRYDSMMTLQQVQRKLPPATQLFEYFWGDSMIVVVTATQDTAVLGPISASQINPPLDRILPWLVNGYLPDSMEMNYPQYATLSYDLYQNLIAPYLDPNCDRLIISADNKLALLPFEALITETGNTASNFSKAPYLIRNVEIQYAYSSNILFKSIVSEKKRHPSLLAFAFSDEAASTPPVNSLPAIPYSFAEIITIGDHFKKTHRRLLHGKSASKQAFLKLTPDFDIVHLAIHGIADTTSGLNSRLIFPNPPYQGVDNRLYAHELYNMPASQLRLAVLSACESGIGKNYAGEGMFSIARGFAYAGIPSMVMSLWKVNDQSTEILMDHFYENLLKGRSLTRALQVAKIKYLEHADPNFAKPYFWAGLVSMGDGGAICISTSWWYYFPFILLILICLWKLFR